eukprot:TRINITY_DN13240_c0_g1_i1.p1 TRINITY_DN13240_c0_g1~~TRINITY_DN13240_c0_g1_i1.p1  ORF type:complete len:256 (-),score=50.65 TRINITY_DN13240_c0_g1_i1:1-768(-)
MASDQRQQQRRLTHHLRVLNGSKSALVSELQEFERHGKRRMFNILLALSLYYAQKKYLKPGTQQIVGRLLLASIVLQATLSAFRRKDVSTASALITAITPLLPTPIVHLIGLAPLLSPGFYKGLGPPLKLALVRFRLISALLLIPLAVISRESYRLAKHKVMQKKRNSKLKLKKSKTRSKTRTKPQNSKVSFLSRWSSRNKEGDHLDNNGSDDNHSNPTTLREKLKSYVTRLKGSNSSSSASPSTVPKGRLFSRL